MSEHDTPEYLSYSGDGYCDITLDRQVTLGNGVQVANLRMREPTVEDHVRHEEHKGSEAAKEIATMAHLTEMSPEDIKRLPIKSYLRLKEAYQGFLL